MWLEARPLRDGVEAGAKWTKHAVRVGGQPRVDDERLTLVLDRNPLRRRGFRQQCLPVRDAPRRRPATARGDDSSSVLPSQRSRPYWASTVSQVTCRMVAKAGELEQWPAGRPLISTTAPTRSARAPTASSAPGAGVASFGPAGDGRQRAVVVEGGKRRLRVASNAAKPLAAGRCGRRLRELLVRAVTSADVRR